MLCSLRFAALALAATGLVFAQSRIDLGRQGDNIDFRSQPYTRPIAMGATLPGTCTQGDVFFLISTFAGENLYGCTATNTWTLQAGGATGLQDPGANGVVERTALNTTTSVPAPAGAIVGTWDAQTLTNKSIAASEITSGTFASTLMPAFSGDATSAAGATALTLANSGATAGSYTIPSITVDSKGRVTSISNGSSSAAFNQTVQVDGAAQTQAGTLNFAHGSNVTLTGATAAGVTTVTVNSSIGSLWSGLGNPTGNLTLSMGSFTSGFTWGATTGASDLFKLTDTASNTGTGILAHFTTAAGSTEIPWQADANGVGWKVDATGTLHSVGASHAGMIELDQGPTPVLFGANSFSLYAPASIPSEFAWMTPSADGNGALTVSSDVMSVTALQGTDSHILTAGTVAGTSAPLCTDANGGATTAGCPAGGGGGGSGVRADLLANIGSCSPGAVGVFFATDQPAGQQFYTCSHTTGAYAWTQVVALGPSAGLAYDASGALDIATSVIPRLAAANAFTGLNTLSQPPVLPRSTPSSSSAPCTAGQLWFDVNFVYACTATNTIRRSALASF